MASFIWRRLFGVVTSQFRVLIDDVSNVESLNMAPKGLNIRYKIDLILNLTFYALPKLTWTPIVRMIILLLRVLIQFLEKIGTSTSAL